MNIDYDFQKYCWIVGISPAYSDVLLQKIAYTLPVLRPRNRLAALDHNMNVERPVQKQ